MKLSDEIANELLEPARSSVNCYQNLSLRRRQASHANIGRSCHFQDARFKTLGMRAIDGSRVDLSQSIDLDQFRAARPCFFQSHPKGPATGILRKGAQRRLASLRFRPFAAAIGHAAPNAELIDTSASHVGWCIARKRTIS
jgi:hypothetical protein